MGEDWMTWVKERKVPYFGAEVDNRMKEDFLRLRLGVQPTEEMFESNGVQAFRDKVADYHASLKLHHTLVRRRDNPVCIALYLCPSVMD
jgi:thymidine kinase